MRTRLYISLLIATSLLGCASPAVSTRQPLSTQPASTQGPADTAAPTPISDPAPTGASATPDAAHTAESTPAIVNSRPIGQFIEFDVPADSHPHDVAPAPDGTVWFTAQQSGGLGRLDPATGEVELIPLPSPSAPHGVIVGPDGAPWITDSAHNAIVRVDPVTEQAQVFPLPADRPNANLNTAAFDGSGMIWFTGQNGIYGRLDPATGDMQVFDAPRGRGPYGITATPSGEIYYASLAGSYIAHVNIETGGATVIEPPTPNQGARRVWSDSQGRIWVSEWNVGQLGVYDPAADAWQEWRLPGASPQAYAVYVDEHYMVWVTDFGGNALHRFDPQTEQFETFPFPDAGSTVRQLLGRPGEIWGAESGLNRLFVLYTAP